MATRRVMRWRRPRFMTIMIIVAAVYLAYLFFDQSRQLARLRHEAEYLRQRAETLKQENTRLQEEKAQLQTDAYIEKLAREQLGLVKPGETLYVPGQKRSDAGQ